MTLFIGGEDGWKPLKAVTNVVFTPDEEDANDEVRMVRDEAMSFSATATFDLSDSMLDLFFYPFMSPRERRRIRKQRKLAAHYQAKLDRVPAWKRGQS